MSNEKQNDEPGDTILYRGNAVPKILRWIYIAFSVWAVVYLLLYAWPDLKAWLN